MKEKNLGLGGRKKETEAQVKARKEAEYRARKEDIAKSLEAAQFQATLKRQADLFNWRKKLSDKIDPEKKDKKLDPREEAILKVQHLSVRMAISNSPYTESDMANQVLKIKDELRKMHVSSNNPLYGKAVEILDWEIIEGRRGYPLWQIVRHDVGSLRLKEPGWYIKNFYNPEYVYQGNEYLPKE